nr:hypothetical protein [Tanacetum cinerariifolium]
VEIFLLMELVRNARAGNSFVYDPNPESFNELQSIFNPPPQSHYKIYLCQLCESNSHYSYECSQRVLLIYEPEPCYNQSFGDNAYPHDSPGVTPCIDHHCCYKCGDSLDAIAITLDLPTVKPEDSLRIGDEHLDTILKTKSDEFIKSSVENLVQAQVSLRMNVSVMCPLVMILQLSLIFSLVLTMISPLVTTSHFLMKTVRRKSIRTLFLMKNPEEEIRLIEKLFYDNSSPRPPEEFISENSNAAIESFSPSPILIEDSDSLRDEIDLSLTPDDSMPPCIEDDDYDSEGDMLILEELLSNDFLSLLENESFHFDIPSSSCHPVKPPDDDEIKPNSEILTVKVVGDISEHYVPMPRLLPIQPTLASNQEKSHHLLYQWGLKSFQHSSESPMMIYGGNIPNLDVPFLHFYPH